uniref:Phosphatase n=1 Tax=Denticeps clupeoides TaxID=299321 RepID=A0AAY4E3C1_9TELE
MKTLVVFDFDHTLVDDNSDTWVVRSTPDKRLPDWLTSSYENGRWTEYMGRVLAYIGDQAIGPDSLREVMETIPFTDGMVELLTFIAEHKRDLDCIIISDSNSMFIEWILGAAGVQAAVDEVFTNPASIDGRGYMVVRCCHSHDCSRCPVNLCKKKALQDFTDSQGERGVRYQRRCYVGDGRNDLCPVECLSEDDVAMPRKGYALERLLSKVAAEDGASFRPRVVGWTSGKEIIAELDASGEG